ncbi:DUF221-domain-containing protein [Fomitiporia mediterranea MF3/22]|uniref:DUF221-domain-containing protein n=1 Tax=Fomitiporia mediterranea (strain MF3/22) TaxID=694068 RepID=UPI000440823F|nr:DUF221-domain-containing protein [Fomitiporia mediterranea MF3/22]EJD08522.1 DUF221-domain-containing protein [Fomitiporia mediterranea MF3/22]
MINLMDLFLDDPDTPAPPGSPPTRTFEGPWFRTQLVLSLTIGIVSFFLFSYSRTRWPLLFAPRTKLKGFSPHEAHAHSAFFGWILPTIKTSEITILQIVGLDAAVLLNFFKMSFYLFTVMSLLAIAILMPINYKNNIGMPTDEDGDPDWYTALDDDPPKKPPSQGSGRDWMDLLNDANSYLSVHLLFTYIFTFLALRFIHKNYARFIRARQLFSLELVHSIAARTVMVSDLPNHLRGERALAVYFENMDLTVESVSLCREVSTLKELIDRRTDALLKLEKAWTDYLGNPSNVDVYDPSNSAVPPLIDIEEGRSSSPNRTAPLVVPHRKRPTIRPSWFRRKVDALEYLEAQFKEANHAVEQKRKTGKFKASHTAFVTFEKMSSAQIAAQVAHAPQPLQCTTVLAPEPRDIVWDNMTHSTNVTRARELIVLGMMMLIFFFWVFPITALASLLSYEEIKKTMPWLGRWIDANDQLRAIVQNVLPSVAMISLNALLPFLFEALTYFQGYRARSWIEYSLLKKYFLFLLVNVVFIFLLASTYWQLIRELAESPAKVPERIAQALHQGRARYFFLSYVLLQSLGIMPLQLLNLGIIIPRIILRAFVTRTPRDYAELNAPPMINYGVVYPQAILVFVVTMLYSVIQPTILIFGALYFGIGYLVYKYKLLFVFYKPYESQGQAWPITFTRLIWGIFIFQIFMTGLFLLKKGYVLSFFMALLMLATFVWSLYTWKLFKPLSKSVNLSSVFEVQRGEESAEILRMRAGHPVTWSQSNLNRRRYAQNDETLYVAPEDERTDYSQPPMANWYNGVLNTGKRRYGHPALNGVLPQPWLPLKKGQTLVNREAPSLTRNDSEAVVLTLRKRYGSIRKGGRRRTISASFLQEQDAGGRERAGYSDADSTLGNPWTDYQRDEQNGQDARRVSHRLSFDNATGVIVLPEDAHWLMEDADTDSEEEDYGNDSTPSNASVHENGSSVSTALDAAGPSTAAAATATPTATVVTPSKQRHGTYFHHPEKRRKTIPGEFPGS